ncbi:aKG-HExxH-type peptide beta-hydroxylase [Nonomuraea gerenzanensis]|uniref:HEXXH motif domain-containing protein n=1 Tax=Nonomuraea gerenzanensis TaxID=93944 RepID=A0A1M4EB68_9ACTN|nr:HEXXH motif-containing putative peptide modification protein [Nonomuraea gerenzanensis]UBU18225.1 hypothetical protein LCN96_25325 [Nonomuraea gerenzanensis]SBO96040.1 hypothetical protein BN4615_P5556 [Nonomuraea gerenzanensis]
MNTTRTHLLNSDEARREAEEILAGDRPFGDCDYIRQRTRIHYRHRLLLLKEHSKGAHLLFTAQEDTSDGRHHQVLGDPAVRVAIDTWLGAVLGGRELPWPEEELDAVLETAAARSARADVPPLAEGAADLVRLHEAAWPWVWTEPRAEVDPLGEFFRRVFAESLPGLTLASPDAPARETLLRGAALLHELCPRLARSALSHVHVIVVAGKESSPGFASLTHPRIPGAMFLSTAVLGDAWQAAEYLLHEAMHVKFTDLEHTHSLLGEHYDAETSPLIRPHWNRARPQADDGWPIDRALTVSHVYTSLALFHSTVAARHAELADRYGPITGADPARQARRSFDRAQYLIQRLGGRTEQLGTGGRLFLRWLHGINQAFDPSPAPEGTYVHLVLDLYEREADTIRRALTRPGAPHADEDAASLRSAARHEIGSCLAVLAGEPAGRSRELRDQDGVLAELESRQASFHDSAEAFLRTREVVLRALSPMPGRREEASAELVRAMVEESGRRLGALLER